MKLGRCWALAPIHAGGIERGGGARLTKQGTWRAKRSSSSRNRSRGGPGFMAGERQRGRELGAPAVPRTAKAGGSGRPVPDPSKRQRGRRSSWAELLVVPHGGSCEEKQREGARCERRSMEPGKKREWRGRDGATERRGVAREAAGAGVTRRRRGGLQARRHAAGVRTGGLWWLQGLGLSIQIEAGRGLCSGLASW